MKVCDKCRKRKVVKTVRVNSKDYELCQECWNRVVMWLEKPESDNILNLFGGKY